MLAFYDDWEDIKHRKFDGFIITGAPVETPRLRGGHLLGRDARDLRLDETNVHSTLNICWGAQAAVYHFHGVPKYTLDEKAFGVFRHHNLNPSSPYLRGFSDDFQIPVSRWTEVRARGHPQPAGPRDPDGIGRDGRLPACRTMPARALYMFNHVEYDSTSLADEYFRDVDCRGADRDAAATISPTTIPASQPENRWRSHAHLLFGNWINEMYQTTPYDLEKIGSGGMSLWKVSKSGR